jgi:predicted GIY-YIG superfamily endonuclease
MTQQKPRNYYKYYFKEGNKIIHGGITTDLERREQEHQQKVSVLPTHLSWNRPKDYVCLI